MLCYDIDHSQNDEEEEKSHVDILSVIQVSHMQESIEDEVVRVSLPPFTISFNYVFEVYVI